MSSLYAPVPLGLRRFGRWRWCHRGWRRSHLGRRWRCVRGRGLARLLADDHRARHPDRRGRLHAVALRPALMLVSVPLPYSSPFHSSPRPSREQTLLRARPSRNLLPETKNLFGAQNLLARRRGLFRRCRCWRGSRCGAARTPRRALLTLERNFFLALQIFVQSHGLILDHVVLHAQTALQLGDQFAVRGADFLVHVNSFAVLGHAVRELSRAPVLGLFDLAAFFRDGVLDDRQHFLDLVFRRRRAHDKNQIVITLFHDDLFFF